MVTPSETPITTFKAPEPQPVLIRHIDERMALHLLMYFTHWINVHLRNPSQSTRLVEAHGRWIFALLSKVDEQLTADDMCLLRNLSRACIAFVKSMLSSPNSSATQEAPDPTVHGGETLSVRSCWIILQTIVSVWAQRDLWMDAEEALRDISDL